MAHAEMGQVWCYLRGRKANLDPSSKNRVAHGKGAKPADIENHRTDREDRLA